MLPFSEGEPGSLGMIPRDIFRPNAGKYSIHGAYGLFPGFFAGQKSSVGHVCVWPCCGSAVSLCCCLGVLYWYDWDVC